MKLIRSRAPSRIDFLGGGSDAPPFSTEHRGFTLNGAINRYATCTLELGDHLRGVEIRSLDMHAMAQAGDVDELEFSGPLSLLNAAIRRSGVRGPFRLTTEADVPPQSGLGASASITAAVIAACFQALGRPVDPLEVTELAFAAERLDLGLAGGKQDQCGAAWGGIRCYEFKDPQVIVHEPGLTKGQIFELEHRLLLVYTGVTHLSGNIHSDIKAAYHDENSPCKKAMFSLAKLGREGLDVLRRGELAAFGQLLNENWKYHQDLHASCTNERLREVYGVAEKVGIVGAKTCGAGGGGCVVFYCHEGKKRELAEALHNAGCQLMHFSFDFNGVQAWEVKQGR